jgi:hypothetical protein
MRILPPSGKAVFFCTEGRSSDSHYLSDNSTKNNFCYSAFPYTCALTPSLKFCQWGIFFYFFTLYILFAYQNLTYARKIKSFVPAYSNRYFGQYIGSRAIGQKYNPCVPFSTDYHRSAWPRVGNRQDEMVLQSQYCGLCTATG